MFGQNGETYGQRVYADTTSLNATRFWAEIIAGRFKASAMMIFNFPSVVLSLASIKRALAFVERNSFAFDFFFVGS